MNKEQKILLLCFIGLVIVFICYNGYGLIDNRDLKDKPFSFIRTPTPIPEGRWYKLELKHPASCDDFPSWFTSMASRRCYDREDCLRFYSRSVYSVKGIEILPEERSLPCHIAMWKGVDYNREFCDFKAGDEIWFWREE